MQCHPDVFAFIETIRRELPPVFALSEIDGLTGGALRSRTIANLRSKAKHCNDGSAPCIPSGAFLRQGKKIICRRDVLLDWWRGQLAPADQY